MREAILLITVVQVCTLPPTKMMPMAEIPTEMEQQQVLRMVTGMVFIIIIVDYGRHGQISSMILTKKPRSHLWIEF